MTTGGPLPATSAGLLLYRVRGGVLQVLLGHMGGPYWARKDAAAWSIPKGEYRHGEDPRRVAEREFEEELGQPAPAGSREELGTFRQAGGKVVRLWSVEGDLDATAGRSNTVDLEWPPRSGRTVEVPEIDRAEWIDLAAARVRLVRGQVPALDVLLERVRAGRPDVGEGTGSGATATGPTPPSGSAGGESGRGAPGVPGPR